MRDIDLITEKVKLKFFLWCVFVLSLILCGSKTSLHAEPLTTAKDEQVDSKTQGFNPEDFIRILGFTLEKDTLPGMKKVLGETPILEKGDAGGYEAKIVYVLKNGSEKVEFCSDELHHFGYVFCEFRISRAKNSDYKNFKKIDLNVNQIMVKGIHLGLTKERVEKILNCKNLNSLSGFSCNVYKKSNKETEYDFLKYIQKKENNEVMTFTEGIGITLVYRQGILFSFKVGMATAT